MIIKLVKNTIDKEHAFDIRRVVFVNEQKVPLEEEIDEFDEESSVIHLLGTHNNKSIATSRIRFVNDYAKLERIAILKEFRGKSFGAEMVNAMEEVILNHQYKKAVLNAQTYTEAFYEKLGFTTTSDVFMDASIPHVAMSKYLK